MLRVVSGEMEGVRSRKPVQMMGKRPQEVYIERISRQKQATAFTCTNRRLVSFSRPRSTQPNRHVRIRLPSIPRMREHLPSVRGHGFLQRVRTVGVRVDLGGTGGGEDAGADGVEEIFDVGLGLPVGWSG